MSSSTNDEIVLADTIGLLVEADIEPERMNDFLECIQKNAEGSRAEAGNLMFDVVKSRDDPNKFFFYELWKNFAAFSAHKKEPHFLLWNEFKDSGGTSSCKVTGGNGLFISATTSSVTSSSTNDDIVLAETIGLLVEADIEPERMNDFLDCIQKNAEGSRAEAGNLMFGEAYSMEHNHMMP